MAIFAADCGCSGSIRYISLEKVFDTAQNSFGKVLNKLANSF